MTGLLQGHVVAGLPSLARSFRAAAPFPQVASAGFCPRSSGASDDGRELCRLLREIRVSPA